MTAGVVIPVRTPAPFLELALDGVLGQSAAPAEVVVVDDGSAPPLRLAERHARRCRLLRITPRGPAGARAEGIAQLSSELIALCDADDVWEEDSLRLRLQALAGEPGASLCFGSARVIGADGAPTGERWTALAPGLHAGADLLTLLYAQNPILTSSVVLRREALEGLELDPGLRRAEDWDLWLQLAARGAGFLSEPRAVVGYRRHPAGLTGDLTALARDQLRMHERHRERVDPALYRRVRAADLTALGHGLLRERRYAAGRAALAEAAALHPASPRDRVRRGVAALPGARSLLGRRPPYR
jgi:glycosyltransferase involved in cell wall biosynthesis